MPGVAGFFSNLDISASGMLAERRRMDVVLSNLANAESTRTREGGPYQRRQVVFESVLRENTTDHDFAGAGVTVREVSLDPTPPIRMHRPGHPDADADGYVLFPDIRTAEEMVDLISAARAYEANAEAFKIAKGMLQRALDLWRT